VNHKLEGTMLALLSLITLIVTTSLAAAAAVALNWILLHTALRLMRTSVRTTAARPVAVRRELVYGTVRLARALTPRGPQA
jgi:heme O synthase-like polyprenyltransferase